MLTELWLKCRNQGHSVTKVYCIEWKTNSCICLGQVLSYVWGPVTFPQSQIQARRTVIHHNQARPWWYGRLVPYEPRLGRTQNRSISTIWHINILLVNKIYCGSRYTWASQQPHTSGVFMDTWAQCLLESIIGQDVMMPAWQMADLLFPVKTLNKYTF